MTEESIYIGINDKGEKINLDLAHANRHGLIAGATGTGKTVTMKVMAEAFSRVGVPVFLCDVKGDVSGIAQEGADSAGMQKRINKFRLKDPEFNNGHVFEYRAYPTVFWDAFGEKGKNINTTVSNMGPLLLSRLLGLTEVQEGILNIVFRVAEKENLPMSSFEDLRNAISYVYENRQKYSARYGNIAAASITSVLRTLIPLENQGAGKFFCEPAIDITEWIKCSEEEGEQHGWGVINVLDCVELVKNPDVYSTFIFWLLTELYNVLPEVGDPKKPKIVFFFDEAHFLFKDAEKALLKKIEQTVKLIRSKGVGIYFVTQSPSDFSNEVLAQLQNRVQHALRAYTPAEIKAVKVAAESFRENPELNTSECIMALGTGEALVSFLDAKGIPQIVQQTSIICPESLMGPCSEKIREDITDKYKEELKMDENVNVNAALSAQALENERLKLELEKMKMELELEKTRLAQAEAEAKKAAAEAEAQAKIQIAREEAERKAREKEEEEARKVAEKAAALAQKEAEKAEAEAKKAAEKAAAEAKKAEEKAAAAEQKKNAARQSKIESQVIQAGGQVLKKTLLRLLKLSK